MKPEPVQPSIPIAPPLEPALSPNLAGDSAITFGLAGRVCIVTGGAQGIGEACVRRFARENAQVVFADVDTERGTALAAELGVLFVRCDVGHKPDVDALVAATLALHGHIDVLVSNAGIFRAADFLSVSEEDFDAVIRVNLKGAFLVGQAVARAMVEGSRAGSIIHMSSVNGQLAIPTIASYNASKGGVNQLTRAMALALAGHGIRVNAIAPGTIATQLAAKAVLTSEAAKTRILSRTPLGRLGTPDEIANVAAFLASDASSYLTGEIIVADGGRMALNYTMDK